MQGGGEEEGHESEVITVPSFCLPYPTRRPCPPDVACGRTGAAEGVLSDGDEGERGARGRKGGEGVEGWFRLSGGDC